MGCKPSKNALQCCVRICVLTMKLIDGLHLLDVIDNLPIENTRQQIK